MSTTKRVPWPYDVGSEEDLSYLGILTLLTKFHLIKEISLTHNGPNSGEHLDITYIK